MHLSKARSIAVLEALAFVAIAGGAAWLFPLEDMPHALTLQSHPEDMARVFGGDPAYYLEMARMWKEHMTFRTWLTGGFPPGMGIAWGSLIFLFGEENLLVSSLGLSILLWGLSLFAVYKSLTFPRPLRFLLVNSLWLFTTFRDWSLGVGTCFSESKSMPFMLICFALLFAGLRKPNRKWIVLAAVSMAVATYLRVYFDTLGIFVFAGLVVAAIAPELREFIQAGRRPSQVLEGIKETYRTKPIFKSVVLGFAVLYLSTFPWKVRNYFSPHVNAYGMGPLHFNITFNNLWLPTPRLPEFIIGGNSACIADPTLCQMIESAGGIDKVPTPTAKKLALLTLVTEPFAWYAHRLKVFSIFWISRPWSLSNSRDLRLFFEGGIVMALGLWALVLSLRQSLASDNYMRLGAWLTLAFFLQTFLMFTFAGMDYRHSLPIRLFFFFAPFWLLSVPSKPETAKTN